MEYGCVGIDHPLKIRQGQSMPRGQKEAVIESHHILEKRIIGVPPVEDVMLARRGDDEIGFARSERGENGFEIAKQNCVRIQVDDAIAEKKQRLQLSQAPPVMWKERI